MLQLNKSVWKQSLTVLSEMNSEVKNRCLCITDDIEAITSAFPAQVESVLLKTLNDVRELESEVEKVSKDVYPYLLVQAMKSGLYASLEALTNANASDMESLFRLDSGRCNEVIVA